MANRANLAGGLVATAPSPATTGTSLTLQTGYGASMPAVPFFMTLSPPNQLSTLGNSEIVSVTARTGDVLTIVRAQKGTTARSVDVGWIAANGVYAEDVATGTVRVSLASSSSLTATTAAWTTLPYDSVVENVGGGTVSSGVYTIPVTGVYLGVGMLRIPDSSSANSIAQGIDVTAGDSSTTLWSSMGGEQRSGRIFTKVAKFNAGDRVRHYYYASSATSFNSSGTSFTLTLLAQT